MWRRVKAPADPPTNARKPVGKLSAKLSSVVAKLLKCKEPAMVMRNPDSMEAQVSSAVIAQAIEADPKCATIATAHTIGSQNPGACIAGIDSNLLEHGMPASYHAAKHSDKHATPRASMDLFDFRRSNRIARVNKILQEAAQSDRVIPMPSTAANPSAYIEGIGSKLLEQGTLASSHTAKQNTKHAPAETSIDQSDRATPVPNTDAGTPRRSLRKRKATEAAICHETETKSRSKRAKISTDTAKDDQQTKEVKSEVDQAKPSKDPEDVTVFEEDVKSFLKFIASIVVEPAQKRSPRKVTPTKIEEKVPKPEAGAKRKREEPKPALPPPKRTRRGLRSQKGEVGPDPQIATDEPTESTEPRDAGTPQTNGSGAPKQNGKKAARGGPNRGRNGAGAIGGNKGKGKAKGRGGRGDSPDPPKRKVLTQEEKDLVAAYKARQAELKKFFHPLATHQAQILDRLAERDLSKMVRKANAHTKVPEYIETRVELELKRDEVQAAMRRRLDLAVEAENRRFEAEKQVLERTFLQRYQYIREEHLRGAQGDIVLLHNAHDADCDETHTSAGSEADQFPQYHELPEPDAHVRGYSSNRITDEKPFHQHLKYDDKVRRDVVDDDIVGPRLQELEDKQNEAIAEENRRLRDLDALAQESAKELERINAPRPMVNAQAPQWNLSAFVDITLSVAEKERAEKASKTRYRPRTTSNPQSQPPTPQRPYDYTNGPTTYQNRPPSRSMGPPTTPFRQSPYMPPVPSYIQPVVGAQQPPLSPFPGGNTPVQTNGHVLKPMPPPGPPQAAHQSQFQQLAPAPPKVAISRAPSASSRSGGRTKSTTTSGNGNVSRKNSPSAGAGAGTTFIFQPPQNAPQHRSANTILQHQQQMPPPPPQNGTHTPVEASPSPLRQVNTPVTMENPATPVTMRRNSGTVASSGPASVARVSPAPRAAERRNTTTAGATSGGYGGRQGKIAMTFVNQTVESRKAAAEGKKGAVGGGNRPLLPKMG